MQKINKIMCCCSNGVGTSLLMQMTMEEALEILGMDNVEVIFGTLSSVNENSADLFVVSEDRMQELEGLPVIGLEDLMDSDIAAEKLQEVITWRLVI